MIVLYHTNGIVTDGPHTGKKAAEALFLLAGENPESILIWCDQRCKDFVDEDEVRKVFRHRKMMVSLSSENYLPEAIGYAEESSFILVNKSVLFPTWRMSGVIGAVGADVINAVAGQIKPDRNFSYFLNSVAKLSMPLGVFCYSMPSILTRPVSVSDNATTFDFFRFVRQHYRKRWIFLILLNMAVYDKKFPVFSALASFFYRRRTISSERISKIEISGENTSGSIDVLIPTIGRKPYLYDFLKDLSVQTRLPARVIIVEQNPQQGSSSELDYLSDSWPFEIEHIFTHQTGACNARNLALDKIRSEWVFFADDDIRIAPDFLEQAFGEMNRYGNHVFNFACLQKGQKPAYTTDHQTSIFGAGCSIASRESIGTSRFNMSYEFGFSEDLEFARQLLDKGYDTVYLKSPSILHLKAPVGGFRTKPKLLWESDSVQPKPSPTVMLYRLCHHTREQLLGYRTVLFFKFYRHQSIKNPLKYLRDFRKRWERSIHYANLLKR